MEGNIGNWVDLVLLAFVAYHLRDGYRRGAIAATLDLASLAAALIGALLLYGWVGDIFASQFGVARPFAKAAGFLAVWTVIELTFPFLGDLLFRRIPEKVRKSRHMKWAGLAPAGLQATFMAALMLSLVVALPFPPAVKSDIYASRAGSVLVSWSDRLQGALDQAFGGAIRETLSFLTIRQGSTETVDLRFTTGEYRTSPEAERRMLDLLNAERTSRGLPPLYLDPSIVPVARAHSADMLERGYFSHVNPEGETPADRATAAGINFLSFGENLAYAPDVSVAHSGLMNSTGHRENILSAEWGRVGIGVQDAGIYGLMFTQNFAD